MSDISTGAVLKEMARQTLIIIPVGLLLIWLFGGMLLGMSSSVAYATGETVPLWVLVWSGSSLTAALAFILWMWYENAKDIVERGGE